MTTDHQRQASQLEAKATTISLTVFTDPFCTWSWGAEPVLRRLQETYGDQVAIEFVMGGLVEDWDDFHDPANGIREPADVAPHWREAADRHGMPVDESVWLEDPPRSSYPPSIAYKAAQLQNEDLADAYLRRLREAFAAEGVRIDLPDTLVRLAREVGLDGDRLREDLEGEEARTAFREDLSRARRNGGTVFPSFLVSDGRERQLLRGYRSFEAIASAMEALVPSLERQPPRPIPDLVRAYGRVATREIAEIYGWEGGEARDRLEQLKAAGFLSSAGRGSGTFWLPA